MGSGVDAHSMLAADSGLMGDAEAVRFATPDSLESYVAGVPLTRTVVSARAALEEEFFLGLRLNRGVNLSDVASRYAIPATVNSSIADLASWGLISRQGDVVRLTDRGRLLSNEVFQRFIRTPAAVED